MKGDFLGFSFDGVHSSRLNITRVSDGDRYSEELYPDLEDNTLAMPGRDGEFYFGSNFKSKPFSIKFAFDGITERNLRQIQKLFSIKKPCKLVFDERPYKVYMAKISGPIELEYVCFDEPKREVGPARDGVRRTTRIEVEPVIDEETGEPIIDEETGEPATQEVRYRDIEQVMPYVQLEGTERIYKGEGTIDLVCTYPFARSQFKTLDEYTDYTNVLEWQNSSGILTADEYNAWGLDQPHLTSEIAGYNAYIPVYNAGDIDAPFYLFIPYTNNGDYSYGTITPNSGDNILIDMDNSSLIIRPITSRKHRISENGIIINTNNHLIEGVVCNSITDGWTTTGEIYNNYIAGGDFGKIECLDFDLNTTSGRQEIRLNCSNADRVQIAYNYLYY